MRRISSTRRSVTPARRRRPSSVRLSLTARLSRGSASRSRAINPFRSRRSHKRVTLDEVSPRSSASSTGCCGPWAASTTRARYWGVVISSAGPVRERAATAIKTRLAVSTASASRSESLCDDSSNDDAETLALDADFMVAVYRVHCPCPPAHSTKRVRHGRLEVRGKRWSRLCAPRAARSDPSTWSRCDRAGAHPAGPNSCSNLKVIRARSECGGRVRGSCKTARHQGVRTRGSGRRRIDVI